MMHDGEMTWGGRRMEKLLNNFNWRNTMKKHYGLSIRLATLVFASLGLFLFATIASAADIKASGWVGTKTHLSNRPNAGQIYPTKDMDNYQFTEMRGRVQFELIPSEVAGAVWHNEIDYNFGGAAYQTGRGLGGGLGSDTTNLETKQLYLYFKAPSLNLKTTVGINWVTDDFDWIVIGNDAAGFQFDYAAAGTKAKLGAYRFWQPNIKAVTNNVDLYMLSGSQQLSPAAKIGVAGYWLKDGTGAEGNGLLSQGLGSTANGLANLSYNAATGNKALIPLGTKYDLNSYFTGIFGDVAVGPVKLEAWGVYNFGKVDQTGKDSIDIKGFATDVRASAKAGPVALSLDYLYVSGSDKNADKEFGFTNSGLYSVASNFNYKQGMMILLPDGNDWNKSSAFAYNASNIYEDRFLGVTGLFGNVRFPLPGNFSGKIGVGMMYSAEKREVNGNSLMGTEVNGTWSYAVNKNASINLNAAYAFTGDFYKVSAAQAAASTKGVKANTDPDNVSYTTLVFQVNF